MPPRFMCRGPDVYLPIAYRAGETPEGVTSVWVTARKKPGVTDAQAQADLDPIFRDLARRSPATYPKEWRGIGSPPNNKISHAAPATPFSSSLASLAPLLR